MKLRIFILLILCLTTKCLAIQKNVNSQKWTIFAFDRTDNTARTGDLGQITGSIWKDGVEDVIADTNPTELAHGYYEFDLDQAETNGNYLVMDAVSATGDIQVVGCPMGVWTTAPYFSVLSIDSNGRLDIIKVAGTTQTANDMSGDVDTLVSVLGALDTAAASGVPTDSDEIMAYVKQLINDTRTTIFHGRGLSAYSVVSTATSVTEFAAAGLDVSHHVDDYFNSWWIYVLDADQGAPLHEWRQVSNYASTGGVVTHAAFSVQLEVGDQVLIVNPAEHASIAVDTLTKASGDGDLAAVLTDTAAWDTANEARTLLTGGTTALSILTTSDNIGINWGDVSNPTTVINLSGTTIKTATDVEADTDDIGVAGIGLTAINLPNQTMDIIGNITGNLSGSVGTLTGGVDLVKIHGTAITENTSGRLAANFTTFVENADSATAKTLDDVGGTAGLEVDVTKIHGTAITESTSGRIAGNFSTFWDNADAATAKVVDNVGASAAGGGSELAINAGNLGDYKKNTTVYFIWRTIDQGGAAVNPSTAGTIRVYKNNGTGEVTAPKGITDTRIFDSLTGIHLCSIDLNANTFYALDRDYSVVLAGAVIDSQTVTAVIGTFSIEKKYSEPFWIYN